MTKKERVKAIYEVFSKIYDAKCTLDYEKPYQLMIATRLAAQCTDARVNIVMKDLVKKYPTLEAFANASYDELSEDVHSTGFFRHKARDIIAASKMLIEDFDSVLPDNMEDLLKLPGVGRKTANVLLGDIYGKPAIVVDTHAGRLARRMGFTKNTDPYKVELDLKKIIPDEIQAQFCHQLVYHGREYCKSRKPECDTCPVNMYCEKLI